MMQKSKKYFCIYTTRRALASHKAPHLPREMTQKLAENTTPAKGNYKEEYEMQHLPHKLNSEPTEHKHEMLHLPQEEL